MARHPAGRSWAQTAELLYVLVLKDLRVRYKSSFLGYLWALANPLAFALVYYVAFGMILQRGADKNFAVTLITGLFPWAWVANAVVQATGVYRHNPSLVRKVQVRRAVLPLASCLQEMLHFFFAAPVILAFVTWSTGEWHLTWLVVVPVMAAIQLVLIYPIGVALAAANVVVRDVEYLVTIGLQMLFFLTPIVYPADLIPAQYQPYFNLNPFKPLIQAWREVFFHGRLDFTACGECLIFAAIFGAIAVLLHRMIEPRIGELL